jgi:transposase-like protein
MPVCRHNQSFHLHRNAKLDCSVNLKVTYQCPTCKVKFNPEYVAKCGAPHLEEMVGEYKRLSTVYGHW